LYLFLNSFNFTINISIIDNVIIIVIIINNNNVIYIIMIKKYDTYI